MVKITQSIYDTLPEDDQDFFWLVISGKDGAGEEGFTADGSVEWYERKDDGGKMSWWRLYKSDYVDSGRFDRVLPEVAAPAGPGADATNCTFAVENGKRRKCCTAVDGNVECVDMEEDEFGQMGTLPVVQWEGDGNIDEEIEFSLEGDEDGDGIPNHEDEDTWYNKINLPKIAPVWTDTCADRCRDMARKRKEVCDIVRKRVALWLTSEGCPSTVTAEVPGTAGCCS
jgi:hypothetical protein